MNAGWLLFAFALLLTLALLLMAWRFPAWFAAQGLPPEVTGLNVGPAGWRSGHKSHWRWVLGLAALGLVLRLIALDTDLWLDEISTLTLYGRWSLGETLTTFVAANQHVFYVTLARISIGLFGPAEWSVRLPAVLFGVGSLLALYAFARLLTSEREALWTTALMTVSYHHIWFSQNARAWTGLLFFSLLGTVLFLHGLAGNRTRTWVLYGLVMALGIFTHLNTLFVFLGHFAAYLLLWWRLPGRELFAAPRMRRLLWVGVLTAVLTLLQHSFILPQMVSYYLGNPESNANAWGFTNPLELLSVALQGLMLGFLGVGLLLFAVIVLPGLVSYGRQSPLLVGLLVLPGAFNVAAVFLLNLGLHPRTFFYILPLGLLLAVRGAFLLSDWLVGQWRRMRPAAPAHGKVARNLAHLLLALVFLASLASLIPYYRTPKQDYSGALAYVEAQRRPEDVVVAVGLAASGYRGLYGPHLAFPQDIAELSRLQEGDHATWVLYTFTRNLRVTNPALLDYLEENFTPQASFPGTVGDGTIYVLRAE